MFGEPCGTDSLSGETADVLRSQRAGPQNDVGITQVRPPTDTSNIDRRCCTQVALYLAAFMPQFHEMRRARYTRVVSTNQLFANLGDISFGSVEDSGQNSLKVIFHATVVLRRGRDDPGELHKPLIINSIAMIKQAAGGLRGCAPFPRTHLEVHPA